MDALSTGNDAIMNDIIITRPKYYDSSFRFYNTMTSCLQHDIWNELEQGMWKVFDIDAFLENERQYAINAEHKKKIRNLLVFPHFAVVEPGHAWNDTKSDTEIVYTPIEISSSCSHKSLMTAVEDYFQKFEGEKIGVHLSGGLDTSIIMAWLHELGIPFVAIGFKSNRWEFRTERRVQERMAQYAQQAELIDIDDFPFYSELDQCPKCQSPYGLGFKDYSISQALVARFKKLGVTTVFSGQGGDTLFVEKVPQDRPLLLAVGDEFEVCAGADMYYSPAGIKLEVPFADMNIIRQIASLRLGENEDVSKWWARRYFKGILPKELSEFGYVADMYGLELDGLEMAKPVLRNLFNEVYELTHNNNFSPYETCKFLETNVFEFEFKEYVEYGARLSVAAWLHALFRNDENSIK